MDIPVALTITRTEMDMLVTIVSSIIAPIALGWLWYLQKRADTLQDKLTATEQAHFTQMTEMERKFSDKLLEVVTKFVDMHTSSASSFVTKDDFNRQFDNVFKKLDHIEDLMQKKADKTP